MDSSNGPFAMQPRVKAVIHLDLRRFVEFQLVEILPVLKKEIYYSNFASFLMGLTGKKVPGKRG